MEGIAGVSHPAPTRRDDSLYARNVELMLGEAKAHGLDRAGAARGRGDVVAQLEPLMPADLVVLPRVMFDFSGERTIDEWSTERISEALGAPVVLGREPIELVRAVRALARQRVEAPELVAA
jgi:hypothetical protein